jgi:UDP-N-acetylglucosamine--N-acetylmuramyl-(pentapeptide) pyrophosphoryl-undecaprenol N-acetylglucosamine transferase
VADQLRSSGATVEFVGGQRAESELVPAHGYRLHALRLMGIDRKNPLRALRAIGLAGLGFLRARTLLKNIGADVVVGAGGYVSGPVGLAARTLGLPLVLCEADSHLGIANRVLAPLSERVFLAFALDGRKGPKYAVTGRPVPADARNTDRQRARERFGVSGSEPCLLVFGGSLGAQSLNDACIEAFGRDAPCNVIHACGHRDFERLAATLADLGRPSHYHLHGYIEPFSEALAASELVVGRAGGSVFEIAAAGVPAILVPYPHATADHQTKNARWMQNAGACVVIDDTQLDASRLKREVSELLKDSGRLLEMGQKSQSLARPEAAAQIASQTLALV